METQKQKLTTKELIKANFFGVLSFILILTGGTYAAWDSTKSNGSIITASDWNTMVGVIKNSLSNSQSTFNWSGNHLSGPLAESGIYYIAVCPNSNKYCGNAYQRVGIYYCNRVQEEVCTTISGSKVAYRWHDGYGLQNPTHYGGWFSRIIKM